MNYKFPILHLLMSCIVPQPCIIRYHQSSNCVSKYYIGNPCLAILTPKSCMIHYVKTQSPDAADWHIDYLLSVYIITSCVIMGSSCISHELGLSRSPQITQENGQAWVASIIHQIRLAVICHHIHEMNHTSESSIYVRLSPIPCQIAF